MLGIGIPREDFAGMIGTATETAIRTLSDFKDEGLIATDKGRRIVLLNKEKLHGVCRSLSLGVLLVVVCFNAWSCVVRCGIVMFYVRFQLMYPENLNQKKETGTPKRSGFLEVVTPSYFHLH